MTGTSNTLGLTSAYTATPQATMSEHYSGLRVLGAKLTIPLARPVESFGFSRERWLQGEADAQSGRVHSLDDVMNALRTQVRDHRV